ncbi:RNA polymerase I associated factor, A49-like protein [Polychytrium aggregatum]|uniref:RNA polymerase I associated factor, A49-like protein n=1 Tax=Polychytrium aggregatum TaxID=110093 RepID=UPI0022FE2084|nr:RNA polymerase I associated factor, A49-like protein [Polychytrium aggregatum]KAI9202085.1 RNA polymerase I associated factor, A49-like protein [Polychytrium aggregatum]
MSSNKRKSVSETPADSRDVRLRADQPEHPDEGPFLVSFSSKPKDASTLSFTEYHTAEKVASKRKRILAAENDKITYVGNNTDARGHARYVVGVYNKRDGTVKLREAPTFRIATLVKSQTMGRSELIGDKNMAARNVLGESFGTKKKQKEIRAYERNQVDINTLKDIAGIISDQLHDKASAIPTQEQIQLSALQDRPIPKYNPEAKTPEDVYHVDDIVSPLELRQMNYKSLLSVQLKSELEKALSGLRTTQWVVEHLQQALQSKADNDQLRKILYVSHMMRFYGLKENVLNNPNQLYKILGNPSEVVVEGLLNRFTELQDDEQYRMTARLKDKLLAHILVLCLIIDNYTIEPSSIARDLSLTATKVTSMCKELGCRVANQRGDEIGAVAAKTAMLVVPLTFPQRSLHRN